MPERAIHRHHHPQIGLDQEADERQMELAERDSVEAFIARFLELVRSLGKKKE
jgi:hypothetical protein